MGDIFDGKTDTEKILDICQQINTALAGVPNAAAHTAGIMASITALRLEEQQRRIRRKSFLKTIDELTKKISDIK